ncbi:NADPH:quinone oxidoreductase family protein [Cypionkella sp.]|uniref:NADPH:quinone oxidoreductase family protein n=1 Tax=Cypionkella sp. TaxID=2811411 RepID=UPI0026107BA4|nr:NADPH:quinone oxidoreductase family protein [Cypionkella sp.]MDB5663795.1 zinc-binding dehydrogenase [Cypionkella sp.]
MKIWQVASLSGPPAQSEQPRPTPAPGFVQLKVAAVGLNFADLLMGDGKYQERPALPFIPGMEFAGTIEAIGCTAMPATSASPGPDLSLGQRVAGFATHGALAEYITAPADQLILLPDSMSFQQAAAFQIAYGTSHLALWHKARLQPGETLLVLGAAGGVGLTAVEIGKRMGARVVACARGSAKLEIARAAGADILIDSDTPDLKSALKAATNDFGGVDVVYDPVGGPAFNAAMSACRPEGRLLTIGFASGQLPEIPANHLLVKNLSVIGLYWGGYMTFAPHILSNSLRTLFQWFAEGGLRPHISHELPFADYPQGLELLRTRQATGKVVITL